VRGRAATRVRMTRGRFARALGAVVDSSAGIRRCSLPLGAAGDIGRADLLREKRSANVWHTLRGPQARGGPIR
jgi:hypothetical protein